MSSSSNALRTIPSIPLDAGASAPAPSSVEPWRLSILELSLSTASLERLEGVARRLPMAAFRRLFDAHPEIEELAAISTCHRVELIVLDRRGDPQSWRTTLPLPAEGWRAWSGPHAIYHLHRVAAGLESSAPGEREVRAQVERASRNLMSRHPRPVLRDLLRSAVAWARQLDVPLSSRQSIASLASARVLQEVPKPFPRVVVVGTGAVGGQVVESLGPYARVTNVYRSAPPSDTFLRATGARAVPLVDLKEELRHADAVVAAAKVGERILGPEHLTGRSETLVVIDLGLPRNVDPTIESVAPVRLVNLEALHAEHAGKGLDPKLEEAVASSARADWARIQRWLLQPWVDHLMQAAEQTRQSEIRRAAPYLRSLSPTQREAVDHLTQRLTEKLLGPPVNRLRALSPDRQYDAERETAVYLLGGTSPEP